MNAHKNGFPMYFHNSLRVNLSEDSEQIVHFGEFGQINLKTWMSLYVLSISWLIGHYSLVHVQNG